MTDSTSRRAGRRPRRFWGPLLGFLLGVALTIAVTVGLLGLAERGETDVEATPEASAPADTPAPAAGSADVPAPCVEAAQQNQTFGASMDEAAVAIRDEDAAALAEILDRIQEDRPAMDDASQQCLDLAGVEGEAATEEPSDEDGGSEDEADRSGSTPEPTATP